MKISLKAVTPADKYTVESGLVYLTGTQALVRLPMMQRRLDLARGLNTAGFISGYRGSPLAGLDNELWRAGEFLKRHHIQFQPGVNEDLAATAVWGSQQVNLYPGARYDGVFAMWYGKGPGVDRSGDVFKHANAAGSSRRGGVLLLAGDDHDAESSSLPHQSEYAFIDAMIPVLNPAGIQEFLDLGLYGWALSRYSGCLVALKTITETVNSSASVYVDPHRVEIALPQDFEVPRGGLNIRWPDGPLEQERRLHDHKLKAAIAFARANRLNRIIIDSPRARFGIVTAGKSYLDVRQALENLGIDEAYAAEVGIRIYRVGMSWPLEPQGVRRFARGLEEVLVVEEKRPVIESQLKEHLYDLSQNDRPRVVGKFDETGRPLLPSTRDLTPELIARIIAGRISRFHTSDRIRQHLAFLNLQEMSQAEAGPAIQRTPYFCSGCPHNTSTRVPEGSRAVAGIGCHYMVNWMDRDTATFTQMGGEGMTWIGQAPFTETPHIFQNLGDGTYFHSGSLAIRAALAAKSNITFKILFNDAVAMTGGQPLDGPLSVPRLTQQLHAEGVRRIAVVSDDPDKYATRDRFAPGVTIHHRNHLDIIQKELREYQGVSILVYDQACAAELRRKRKRGLAPNPPKRVFINEMVCEGCGDCGVQSNCLSIVPVETEFGRKRAIDQSSCNKDFSCLKGFCPSFVTIEGGSLRRRAPSEALLEESRELPTPKAPDLEEPYGILIAGIGGTGIVSIAALLGMAAHLEGKGCGVLDMTGLAQKGGAVVSHVRISSKPEDIHSLRIPSGGARLLLGCDLVVSASQVVLAKVRYGFTRALVNGHETTVGEFTHNPDLSFPGAGMRKAIHRAAGADSTRFIDAKRLATAFFGDAIVTNMIMLGYAFQLGYIPLSVEAIHQTIELNGVAEDQNKRAFFLGRLAAHDPSGVEKWLAPASDRSEEGTGGSLEAIVARRVDHLTAYQNAAYAELYERLVWRVRAIEAEKAEGRTELTEAVARYYSKLLAYKDEYEVARLYSDRTFLKQLKEHFEGDFRLAFHLAPPLFPSRDPVTGELRKRTFGPWMLKFLRFLAKFKFLRGTKLDIFGYTAERRMERQLIGDYEKMVEELLARLNPENHELAVKIAQIPEFIRGFGYVKMAHVEKAKQEEAELVAGLRRSAFRLPLLA